MSIYTLDYLFLFYFNLITKQEKKIVTKCGILSMHFVSYLIKHSNIHTYGLNIHRVEHNSFFLHLK